MRKDNPNITFDDLFEEISKYIKDDNDKHMISKAYLYAYEKHFGDKTVTKEDYIVHPLNVAYILSDIKADYQTICAALMHDLINECNVKVEDIVNEFSSEIGSLVDGISKINKLSVTGDSFANHRKILVGLTEDVRVIIIKLAERLHEMRTLWILEEGKQKEISKETLEILIPIAHRLGMNKIKSELEDLCLRYLKPNVYFDIVEKLNQSKLERNANVELMKNSISELLNEHSIEHKIKGRAKSIYSIYKKLDTGRRFSDIYDLLALRIFVKTEQDCYQVLGIIHSKYRPIPKRFKDYIAMPKENGYQSLHTSVIGENGGTYEIQIRTYDMDNYAEYGVASHWAYKEKNKNLMQSAMEEKLQLFRSIIELSDEENDEIFIKNVKADVLNKIIYVFTPKGDVIELPQGSTPIDFAYKVHSKVGDSMVGAIVNDSIVPLDYELQDNDVIKINTNKNSTPSREWIKMAHTSQAKNKIKAYFNRIDKGSYLKEGEELLQKELRKKKITNEEFFNNENLNKIISELKVGDLKELYIAIGSNKISPISVINIIKNKTKSKEAVILEKINTKVDNKVNLKNDILVEGIDDIKVNVASCCKPVLGDSIVGYITKGNGITIHRNICPNVSGLAERLVSVKWNNIENKKYSTSIKIASSDNKNVLIDIISKTSSTDILIQNINTINSNEYYLFDITLLVPNKEQLDKFINSIEAMNNIIRVERFIK